MIDMEGGAQSAMGSARPRLVVLDGIGNQAEQAMGIKTVSSAPPWPVLRLLPPGPYLQAPALTSLDDGLRTAGNKLFPSHVAFG